MRRLWLGLCCLVLGLGPSASCVGGNTECQVAADCQAVEVCVQRLCVIATTEPDPAADGGEPDDLDGGANEPDGFLDGGDLDAGGGDAGLLDAGLFDAGLVDAGVVDAGPPCIDIDLDGRGVDCALGPDCNDDDETSWTQLVGFEDGDGDTVSLAAPTVLCTDGTLPEGFVDVASDPADCDDTDGDLFMPMDLYPDEDTDGAFSATAVTVCTGGTVPAGSTDVVPDTPDCDDADPRRTPGATEICDALDNDCSGFTDEGGVCGACFVDYSQDPLLPYFFCRSPNNWAGARDGCASASYQLVVLEDQSESALVSGLANASYGGGSWWIGLSDFAAEGTWVWVDGTSLNYNGFGGGEPNNDGNEDCVELRNTNLWNDSSCSAGRNFICEANPAPFVP